MTDPSQRAQGRPRTVDASGVGVAEGIYAAASRLMERQPFNDISVAHIVAESGVSRTTFYFYFASKFTVLSGLLSRAMNEIFETVQPFLSGSTDEAREVALERSIRQVTHAWHRHRLVLRAVDNHWQTEPELRTPWLDVVERFVVAGAVEIDREREAGVITSPVPSRTLAATLFWGTERVLHIAGMGVEPDLPDEEAAVAALIAMWRGTLYGR